jgi:1-phosphofructokinase family hexose kinase
MKFFYAFLSKKFCKVKSEVYFPLKNFDFFMILTITLNPLLERRFYFNSINVYEENRGFKEEIKAGGKGINVSRQLNNFNIENLAFTFLGGTNGKLFKEVLAREKIKFSFIHTKNETRETAVIIDSSKNKVTSFFAPNSLINAGEVDEFKNKLEKMIENCEMVIFAGSSPCPEADSIFTYGIELANKYDKISICDTYGNHLQNCIEKSPTIIHNNISEIEKSLKIDLKSEEQKLAFLKMLYEKGIKQAFLTDGGNIAYTSNFDFYFKIEIPSVKVIDATGSGDGFVAGVAYGWHQNLSYEKTLTIAVKLGALNAASFDVCNVKKEELEMFTGNIEISSLGKKMKILDVAPR